MALAQAAVAVPVIVIVAAAAAEAAVAFVVWKFQHLFYMHCLGRFSNAYGKLTFKACSHPLPPPRPLFCPSLFALFALIYRRCGDALGSCLRH